MPWGCQGSDPWEKLAHWDGCSGPQSPPSFLLPGHWWLLPRAALTPWSTGINWGHFKPLKPRAITRGGKEKVPLWQQGSGNPPQQSQTKLFPLMDRIPQTHTQHWENSFLFTNLGLHQVSTEVTEDRTG